MKKILLVDTFNLLFRSYYSLSNLKNAKSFPTGMIYGLVNFIDKLRLDKDISNVVFALESNTPTFRKLLLQEYKENRKELDEALRVQIQPCLDILQKLGFCCARIDGFEADDVIASVCKYSLSNNCKVEIYSTDKDLYQLLVSDDVLMIGKNNESIKAAECIEKFGVKPEQIVDYLALVGDSADNFKGVSGVGPAAAKRLLNEFKSLDGIYSNLNVVGTKGLITKLSNDKDSAYLSQKLAKLKDDLDVKDFFENSKKPEGNFLVKIIDELEEYQLFKHFKIANEALKSQDKIVTANNANTINNTDYPIKNALLLNNDEKLLETINNIKDELIGFDTETDGLQSDCKIIGFSFCYLNNSFYVPINHKNTQNISLAAAKEAIAKLFEKTIIGHNLKFDFKVIKNNFSINYPAKYYDTMILAWLFNPEQKLSLDYLSMQLFNYSTTEFESLVSKNESFADVDINAALSYASDDAYLTLRIFNTLKNKIGVELFKQFENECEFIKILILMEENGIYLKKEKLLSLENELKKELEELQKHIFNIAKKEFNLNSPKQLAQVLFEDLGIERVAKDSTNEAVLNKIKHPIAEYLINYRKSVKILNTYVKPLLELNVNNLDIYNIKTNFLQCVTATGRLASNNPNLQNIPARGKWAKELKSAFIAKDGYSFLSLDYSQIELRMLAHFSKDYALLDAFANNEDIHKKTAMQIFSYVDDEKRAFAKSINFGLIYGMGAKRLSVELGISYSQAAEYIEKYFQAFPSVKDFFARVKNDAKQKGYIQTLLNRKRFFTYANSVRENNAFDRESVNSILQGSAADLIKFAMIKIYPLLNDDKRLLLQIHDELIFEVKDELIQDFSQQIQNIMQTCIKLNVELKTSLSIAKDWANLK
ncbi:DNA polymerase I [Campylobacter canadensis]|uniref:DNA polymerase I n=1 Tax=Campylobacter canadensis TaxID=449520 RepID=UPI0015557E88|nr:DNA polymerase I [Campylobacter canadensis]MBZ7994363.1 DNA polymerase I [Campylobacter canadensis]MBZ7996060.1 DNA polymerase I [Campylobacter canadensis]MBZ7999696.1 DNA polymerase I [Campylobacter canadensis]MBZ8001491.1 DNA polymerase I [Campylobacter canadensis]MBZ8003935.1 DNA polymerase I [Campylobacter canadensis]